MAKNRDFKVHTEGAAHRVHLKSQYFAHGRLKSRFLREIQENARNPDFMQNHMGRPLVSFWARMTSIFHAHQFFINSEHILDVLRAKNEIEFFVQF